MGRPPNRERLLLDTVDAFHDAAADPALWPDALASLAAVTGGEGGTLTFLGPNGTRFGAASPSLAEGIPAFLAHWNRFDIIGARVFDLRLKGVVSDLELFQPRVFETDAFYRDFLHPLGVRNMQGLIVPTPEGERFSITVHYDAACAEIAAEHRETMALLSRHLARAAIATTRTGASAAGDAALVDTVARLGYGAAVVDGSGAVAAANGPFADLLAGHLTTGERLRFRNPAVHAAFERMVAGVRAASLVTEGPDYVAIPRPDERIPLFLRVVPRGPGRSVPGGAVLVLVTDPGRRDTAVGTAFVRAGLTPGESRVAALVGAGLTPAETADRLGIAEETVRTVLKRVFAKLGLGRQADLVRLVERLAPLGGV